MAKRSHKISEILNKAKEKAVTAPASNDFIAESQRLIAEYGGSAERAEVREQSAPSPFVAETPKQYEENTPDYETITEQLRNTKNEVEDEQLNNSSHYTAPEGSPEDDQIPPSSGMHNSVLTDSKASKSGHISYGKITEQLRNEIRNDYGTNSDELRNFSENIPQQLRNDLASNSNNNVTKRVPFRNKSVSHFVTHSETVTEQLRNSNVPSAPTHVNRLSGHKLKIIQTIFDLCQERGSLNTGPVSREVFCSRTGIAGEVIRVTTTRLIAEGFLQIVESRRGSGGYTIYELNPVTHSQIVGGQHRIAEQHRNNSVTGSVTKNVTTAAYSNSSYNNSLNTNITTQNTFADFLEIPSALIETGIRPANILAHIKSEDDLERINESLLAYAFDYRTNGIIKTKIFYGVIKSGQYYHSDAYLKEMEKERQKQALASKARSEANRFDISVNENEKSESEAEEEFDSSYSAVFIETILKGLTQGDRDILIPMLDKHGPEYLPFKNTLKKKFIEFKADASAE